MSPASYVQVGDWFIVWTWTLPAFKHGPTTPVCLGSFTDRSQAQSLCDAFNDPKNHLGGAPQPV